MAIFPTKAEMTVFHAIFESEDSVKSVASCENIAGRSRVSVSYVRRCLSRLEKLKFLKRNLIPGKPTEFVRLKSGVVT